MVLASGLMGFFLTMPLYIRQCINHVDIFIRFMCLSCKGLE